VTLGEAVVGEISRQLEISIEVAGEMVADMRLMNEDIDAAFYDEGENTLDLAQYLCRRIMENPQLSHWLERKARIAQTSLESPAS
jgi:hypothetical protein